MARIDSLLAIVVDQGANELRIGSDREPRMFAQGTPKKLHLPMMPEQTIRELLGDILSPERATALLTRRPVEATHEAGALGSFHVTMTAREGGGLDVLFVRGKRPPPAAAAARRRRRQRPSRYRAPSLPPRKPRPLRSRPWSPSAWPSDGR